MSTIFWTAEGVRCSRAEIPVGRLILADTGLYFVPGKRSAAARRTDQPWLSHALSDDDGLETANFADIAALPPAEQIAAIPGSLHLAPPLASLALDGRELTVTAADGDALGFTLPSILGDGITAWQSHMMTTHAAPAAD